ncbi:hypothetical protein Tco_1169544 [Tanacetum coccineum]
MPRLPGYEQGEDDLSLEEEIELITELMKYQKDLAQIKKYQAQQSKLSTKLKRLKLLKRKRVMIKIRSSIFNNRQDKLKEVYQIFRVGQAPKAYPYFATMLKEFDRDDIVTLWKLVKDRFKTELPKSDLEKCLFWPLKVMFEPVATDGLWQFQELIKYWKLYNSCRVYCLCMEGMIIYMLDDVEYPLPKTTLQKMLDHKCEVSEFNDDLIQMINLIRRQIKQA